MASRWSGGTAQTRDWPMDSIDKLLNELETLRDREENADFAVKISRESQLSAVGNPKETLKNMIAR